MSTTRRTTHRGSCSAIVTRRACVASARPGRAGDSPFAVERLAVHLAHGHSSGYALARLQAHDHRLRRLAHFVETGVSTNTDARWLDDVCAARQLSGRSAARILAEPPHHEIQGTYTALVTAFARERRDRLACVRARHARPARGGVTGRPCGTTARAPRRAERAARGDRAHGRAGQGQGDHCRRGIEQHGACNGAGEASRGRGCECGDGGRALLQQADAGRPRSPLRVRRESRRGPIVIYNIPGRSGVDLGVDAMGGFSMPRRTSSQRRRQRATSCGRSSSVRALAKDSSCSPVTTP